MNTEKQPTSLTETLLNTLDHYQAEDVQCFDAKQDNSHLTDQWMIATAVAPRHLTTLSEAVVLAAKKLRHQPYHTEGRKAAESGWVLVDLGDIILHLMLAEQRAYYQLEALWTARTLTKADQDSIQKY